MRPRVTRLIALLLGLCGLLPLAVESATRYVSPTGTGSTCSSGSRCSLSTGLSQTNAGDTLILGCGTYNARIVDAVPSGISAAQPTVIQSETSRCAILKPTASGNTIRVGSARTHIHFRGIFVNGDLLPVGEAQGRIEVAAGSDITFDDMEHCCSTVGVVVGTGVPRIKFLNGLVRDSKPQPPGGQGGGYVGFYWRGTDGLIDRTEVRNTSGIGIQLYHVDGSSSNRNTVQRSLIHEGQASGIWAGSGEGNIVRDSVLINNANDGVRVRGTNTKIYNNVMANNGRYGAHIQASSPTLRNNAIYGNATGQISGTGTLSNNALPTGTPTASSADFVSAAGDNFALVSGSDLINAGTAAIVTGLTRTDCNGNCDIGPHETWSLQNCTCAGTSCTATGNPRHQPIIGGVIGDIQTTVNGAAQTESNLSRGNTTINWTLGATPPSNASVVTTFTPGADPFRDSARIGADSTKGQRLNAQTITCSVTGGGQTPTTLTVGPAQVERVNTTGVSPAPPPAVGNVAVHDATTQTSGTGTNPSLVHTAAADADLAIVSVVLASNTVQVNSGTAGGQALTLLTRAVHGGTATLSSEAWRRTSPLTGAQTYSLTLSASTEYKMSVTTYRVVDTANPVTLGTNVTTGTGNLSTAIASAAGDLVHDIVGLTPGPGPEMGVSTEAGNTTTTMSWNSSDSGAFRTHILLDINKDPGPPDPEGPTVPLLDAVSAPLTGTTAEALFTHTSGVDANLALVTPCLDARTITVTGATYAGQAMSFVARAVHPTIAIACEVWRLANPPTGAQPVTVTLSGVTEYIITASTYKGTDPSNPLSSILTTTTDSGNPSRTVTSKLNDLAVAVVGVADPVATIAPGTTETELWDQVHGAIVRAAGYAEPGAASVVMNPQLTGASATVMVAFNVRQFETITPGAAVVTQHHYKLCEVDTAEGVRCGPQDTPGGSQNVFGRIPPGGCVRVRASIGPTVADAPSQSWPLWWSKNGGLYNVLDTDSTKDAFLGRDRVKTLGDPTTCLLDLDGRLCAPGAFVTNDPGFPVAPAIGVGQQMEWETTVCANFSLVAGTDFLEFRHRFASDGVLNAYDQTPRVIIVPPFSRDR